MKTIKAGTVPGVLETYAIEDGQTVADVLELAEISPEGRTVMVNGVTVTNFATSPADNATIVVTQKIKGNGG